MTKENETLMVLQNESFNYSRYTDSYLMDSWGYADADLTKSKEDLAAFSFLYEQCKTPKEQRMTACSKGSSFYKPERSHGASSPELISLESPAQIMKLLTNNIPATHSQEVLDLNRKLSPLRPPKQTSPAPQTFIQPTVTESYDKQVINTIFDTLLQGTYQENTTEATAAYGDPFVNQTSPGYSESYTNSPPERLRNDFQFVLGAPQASQHKTTEMPMVYLNKGQFYPITLMGEDSSAGQPRGRVKTVIMAVFENDKSTEVQLKCWNHWHARQPTVKQRVIDIADYKETVSGISDVEEVAFNALSFVWNTHEEAKVFIGINTLSTDFSAQKGVKGMPLNLQIDTYDISTGANTLIHRAACQIKIFCDKGAERKMRDEERKRSKRRPKNDSSHAKQGRVSSSVGADSTCLVPLDDHVTQPVLFIPEVHYSNLQRCGMASSVLVEDGGSQGALKRVSCYSEGGERCSPPPSKVARREESQRVLLYVRKETEEVFDALILNSPTLKGLREAISEKYGVQEDTIGKILKKCKRGIFVNMDDNIIEHYSNHSAFLINFNEIMMGLFRVTLTEL